MKKIQSSVFLLVSLLLLAGCDNGGETATGTITADFVSISELGSGFNSKYYPEKSKVKQRSGKVDVCLDFENTLYGWKAVAKEYERLQGGKVTVNVNGDFGGTTYATKLTQEIQNPNTDWDIVQGNLAGVYADDTHMMNVGSYGSDKNYYCGADVTWQTVLDKEAFLNVEGGRTDQVYMINSENMQTCWFINDDAFNAAKAKGNVREDGNTGYPKTWKDLINLCSKMVEAGYSNPLGISLADSSIRSGQFSWLLRVYGDYYYRQFYRYITNTSQEWSNYDPREANIEQVEGYQAKLGPIAHLMLYGGQQGDNTNIYATTSDDGYTAAHYNPYGYVGANSDLYRDYIGNIYDIQSYLIEDVDQTEFKDVRNQFRLQSKGNKSPQIILDYLGNGLTYQDSDKIEYACFDYPTMKSDYVNIDGDKDKAITRDIGGNGGFISLVKHVGKSEQNELNKDFIQFFLSPYGQTFYYKGLKEDTPEGNGAPTGLSTVKANLFSMPSGWGDFFNAASDDWGVEFNGNVDGNIFLSWGARYFQGMEKSESVIKEQWQQLLNNRGDKEAKLSSFQSAWNSAIFDDYKTLASNNGWKADAYKNARSGI